MKYADTSFDVFVSENSMVEIYRGPTMTVAQVYGADWQSAPLVNVHPAAMRGLAEFHRKSKVPRPSKRYDRYGWTIPAVFAFACAIALWLVLR